jgi:DNA-binding LacI/PurR family transcriptional regulator
LRELATAAGVSIGTASMALSGHPAVATATREKVSLLARRLGYVPNHAAQSLRARRQNALALVIPHSSAHVFSHPYFMEVLRGISEAASGSGFTVVLSVSATEESGEDAYLKILDSHRVDGVIVASAATFDPNIGRLAASGHSFVVLGRYPLDNSIHAVGVEDRQGAFAATSHLIEHDHRRVAHISGPGGHQSAVDRLEGYRDALGVHSLPYSSGMVVEGDYSVDSGYSAMRRLIAMQPRPTAIFAANDEMAFGALRAAGEAGIDVQKDIALIGFDDIQLASVVNPALTTVHQPMAELGSLAARRLMDILDGRPTAQRQIELPTQLVIRHSCGC